MIGSLAAEKERVDLFPMIQRLALKIAGRTMFSLEMGQHGTTLREQIMRYGQRLGRLHLHDFVVPIGLPTPHDWARAWFRRSWIRLIDYIMAEWLKAKTHASCPRDLLMVARDAESGEGFSPSQLRDQIATMIRAGHETTAVALCRSVYLLNHVPKVQERIAQEAAAVQPDSEAEPPLLKLTYARAVLDEVMRLYPPAYVIVRAARQPAGQCRRCYYEAGRSRHHLALGTAPAPEVLARAGCVRPRPLSARRLGHRPLPLPAFWRRATCVHWRSLRPHGSHPGAGRTHALVPN
jgi:unspecific monooxygenase